VLIPQKMRDRLREVSLERKKSGHKFPVSKVVKMRTFAAQLLILLYFDVAGRADTGKMAFGGARARLQPAFKAEP
jgi:hypothetical protein